ncbi:TPA: DUF551 domain-containing protein [Serratia fonticola]
MDKQTESREQFEAWLRSQPHVLNVGVNDDGSYFLREDQAAWLAWQASRECLVVNSQTIPGGWIPCAERMPKPYDPVLFFAAGAHGGVDCCASTYNGYHDGVFWRQDATLISIDTSRILRDEIIVTHWQPIPPPPSTEKQDG